MVLLLAMLKNEFERDPSLRIDYGLFFTIVILLSLVFILAIIQIT